MIVVTGGAFQGKTAFIRRELLPGGELPEGFIIDGREASFEELCSCRCVMHFEGWIRRELEALQHGGDCACTRRAVDMEELQSKLDGRVRELICRNPDLIIELLEMGCGVVPMKKEDRIYRECCGRIGCLLAENGSSVYRVICGLGQRLQ